jgi:4-amino-4-deoxy-L-arabinose transferase-like glycosyltransferase
LGLRPLVPPDEPRYGIIAAQMAESGEWFSLRMADFRYYE